MRNFNKNIRIYADSLREIKRGLNRAAENLSDAGERAYPSFIVQARASLKPLGREVWVTTPFADDSFPIKPLPYEETSVFEFTIGNFF